MVRCLLVPVGRSQEGRNTRRDRMAEKRMPAAERQRETRPDAVSFQDGACITGRIPAVAGPERELTRAR